MWADVVAAAAEHGLAALAGSSPDVGVVGYTLGGGLGWLARAPRPRRQQRHRDRARHRRRRARPRRRATHEPELFWALRGGGGNFGVVTAIEFELFPIAEVYAGCCCSAAGARRARCCTAWREWTRRRCPTRSPRSAASCSSRRCRRSPSRSAAARSSWSRASTSATRRPARRAARAAARARPGDRHVRHDPGRRRSATCTWTPTGPDAGQGRRRRCSTTLPAEAIDALVAPPAPARARRCCRSSCATSAARSAARRRATARVGIDRRPSSSCSPSAWRPTPEMEAARRAAHRPA